MRSRNAGHVLRPPPRRTEGCDVVADEVTVGFHSDRECLGVRHDWAARVGHRKVADVEGGPVEWPAAAWAAGLLTCAPRRVLRLCLPALEQQLQLLGTYTEGD